jgi:hypothetical protein
VPLSKTFVAYVAVPNEKQVLRLWRRMTTKMQLQGQDGNGSDNDNDNDNDNDKCKMRGFLHCATLDEAVSVFGRNDDSFGKR